MEYIPFYIFDFEVTTKCTELTYIPRTTKLKDGMGSNEKSVNISKKNLYSHIVCASKDEKLFSLAQNITDWDPYSAIPDCKVVSTAEYYEWHTVWHIRVRLSFLFMKKITF